ncbi:GmrSD restriction endonuclease domain-containing protein [Isoptericola jiangsuensis]|uniref:GmrSD restriction endonuclease domain-containing protein n=1 Tax=Isoptericola jiangsuensis TaxID=548579 RepID=UPI003AABB22D
MNPTRTPSAARPLWRRPTFVVGLVLLALVAVVGLAAGDAATALTLVLVYVLLSALAGAVVGWTWWGTRGRGRLVGIAGAAVVALFVTAVVASPDDGAPAAVDAAGAAVAADPDPSGTTTPSPSVSPSSSPTPEASPGPGAADDEASGPAAVGTALAALTDVPVKGRAPKTGYDRDEFGPAWSDVDRNGCDTRNDILARDLTGETFEPGTHDCVVLTGTLADPFTGTVIAFQRGQATSTAVQIDHVVALSDAWQKGAQQLDGTDRELFANDPLNLLAVDGPSNGAKGDGDAATWLPPHKAFRCEYVARQVAVKLTYELWVTRAEHDAIADVLSTCPDEPLPAGGLAPDVSPTATAAPPAAEPEPEPETDAPAAVYYENCTAVREAGADPIREGEPGYARHLDRDGDGVGCE